MMRTLAQFLALSLSLAAPSLFAQQADLVVTPTETTPSRVLLGQPVYASFSIANHGPGWWHGVVVHVDADPQWQGLKIEYPTNCVNDCAIPDVYPGGAYVVSITATVPLHPDTLHITLTASSSNDPDTSNNTAVATLDASDAPELRVALSAIGSRRPGARNTLIAGVFNVGSMPANGVALVIDLPPGSKAISGTGPSVILSRADGEGSPATEVASGSFGVSAPQDDKGFVCDPDGARIVCRGDVLPITGYTPSKFNIVFVNPPLTDGGTVSASAQVASIEHDFDPTNNTSTTSWVIPQFLAVTSLADSGPGSLRDTIALANATCRPQCVVGVRIPGPLPPSGFFTIRPQSPLPPMTFPGSLDARAQIDLLGIDFTKPLVMLDGSLQSSGDGFHMIEAPFAGVSGFAVGNFPRFGVFVEDNVTGINGSAWLEDDYLGVDPTGHTAAPNLRGVVNSAPSAGLVLNRCVVSANARTGVTSSGQLSVQQSRIGVAADSDAPMPNGGSGIYVPTAAPTYVLSSVIAWNREFAIALNPQQHEVSLYHNSIDRNGASVDYAMDGLTPNADDDSHRPPNYPILDDAVYDAATNKTVITLHTTSKPSVPLIPNADESISNIDADVYANDHADAQAQRFIGTATKGTLIVDGDLRGQFITAMTRRRRYDCHYDVCQALDEASEISPAIAVR